MFKINYSFDSQHVRVRARYCVRSIQHQFFEITEKTSFFHVFWGDFFHEYFCCFKKYGHVFKTEHVPNQSLLRFIVCSSSRARLRALDLTSIFRDFHKNIIFFMFFEVIFSMNIFVVLRDMDITICSKYCFSMNISKPKLFSMNIFNVFYEYFKA